MTLDELKDELAKAQKEAAETRAALEEYRAVVAALEHDALIMDSRVVACWDRIAAYRPITNVEMSAWLHVMWKRPREEEVKRD